MSDVIPGSEESQLAELVKHFEGVYDPCIPETEYVMARLDGRAFHTYTKGLRKPYESWLLELMCSTTLSLAKEFSAILAYCQSDEITLLLPSGTLFGNRIQKLSSVLASAATSFFCKIEKEAHVTFDCRVFGLPTKDDVVKAFQWRHMDCTKNAISAAATHHFGHKSVHGLSTAEMKNRLIYEGFWNFPPSFLYGTFFFRKEITRSFTEREIKELPPKHLAHTQPNALYTRNIWNSTFLPHHDGLTERFIWGT